MDMAGHRSLTLDESYKKAPAQFLAGAFFWASLYAAGGVAPNLYFSVSQAFQNLVTVQL